MVDLAKAICPRIVESIKAAQFRQFAVLYHLPPMGLSWLLARGYDTLLSVSLLVSFASEPHVIIARLSHSVCFALICIVLSGCKPDVTAKPDATLAPTALEETPMTDAECRAFARTLEEAVLARNRAELDRLISYEDLAIRSLSDLSMTGNQRLLAAKTLKASMNAASLSSLILTHVEAGGSYKSLRLHEIDGQDRVLFRLITEETGVSYHDYILTRATGGQIAVSDIYMYAAGELVSQTLRRLLLPVVAELDKSSTSSLRGSDRAFLNNMAKYQEMAEALRAENKPEVLRIYKTLPEEFRLQKSVMLLYLKASTGDVVEFTKAAELYRKLFPADPAVELLSTHHFMLKNMNDELLRCIDDLDRVMGGDPYLNVLRSITYVNAKRFPEARAAAEEAIEQEPSLGDGYRCRINLSLLEKNYVDTLKWLKLLVEKTTEKVPDLAKEADFKDFIQSPQHAEWVNWYSARKKK